MFLKSPEYYKFQISENVVVVRKMVRFKRANDENEFASCLFTVFTGEHLTFYTVHVVNS